MKFLLRDCMKYLPTKSLTTMLLIVFGMFSLPSNAAVIYDVSSTSKVNCGTAKHGLWTNQDINGGSCSNYFDIMGSLTIDNSGLPSNWTAVIEATATNPQGLVATISLMLSGFEDVYTTYKQEGGAVYSAAADSNDGILAAPDNADIDFFTMISGTIDIGSTSYVVNDMVGEHAFQFGQGANAKDASEFGGSAWVQGPTIGDHWDLNLTFAAVPEPATLVLFALGLLGIGSVRRRNRLV
jgi:hypothetical protein